MKIKINKIIDEMAKMVLLLINGKWRRPNGLLMMINDDDGKWKWAIGVMILNDEKKPNVNNGKVK